MGPKGCAYEQNNSLDRHLRRGIAGLRDGAATAHGGAAARRGGSATAGRHGGPPSGSGCAAWRGLYGPNVPCTEHRIRLGIPPALWMGMATPTARLASWVALSKRQFI